MIRGRNVSFEPIKAAVPIDPGALVMLDRKAAFSDVNLRADRAPFQEVRKQKSSLEIRKMYIVQRTMTFVRGFLLSYGPTKVKKALWDKEFSGDKWNFIDDTADDCIYPHLEKHARGGDILDLGCGPGNTANELADKAYRSYLGVDISESALAKGVRRTNESGRTAKNRFVCSDFLSYMPTQKFDVILFRESMYHIPYGSVMELLNKYSKYLKDGGVFIVRLYLGDRQSGKMKFRVKRKIDLINTKFNVLESIQYDTLGSPTVLVFRPGP